MYRERKKFKPPMMQSRPATALVMHSVYRNPERFRLKEDPQQFNIREQYGRHTQTLNEVPGHAYELFDATRCAVGCL